MKIKEMMDKAGFPNQERIEALHGSSMPIAAPRSILLDKDATSEYLAIAKTVGLDDDLGYILELRLREILEDEHIHVYDYDHVAKFLDNKLQEEWKWMPLRTVDAEEFPGGNWSHTVASKKRYFGNTRYNRPIPLPVLMTVQKISTRLPQARFFISGVERDADPFLCVTTKLLHVYVIERWDEPDYRER